MNNHLENIIIHLENRYIHNNNNLHRNNPNIQPDLQNIEQQDIIEERNNICCLYKFKVSTMILILFIVIITPVYTLVIYDGCFNRSTALLNNTTYTCSLNKLNTIDINIQGRTALNEIIYTKVHTSINMSDYRVVSLFSGYAYHDKEYQQRIFDEYIILFVTFVTGCISMSILNSICDKQDRG